LALAFSPDSKIVAVAKSGGNVQLFDVGRATLEPGAILEWDKNYTSGLCFSPNGSILAQVSWTWKGHEANDDAKARLWDSKANPPKERITFDLKLDRRQRMVQMGGPAFSQDGKTLIVG
jgi:WD40 repeat protein